MELKDLIKALRMKSGLSQEQLAEKLMISRQAVSRWENGETEPGIASLKLLASLFHVSMDLLTGSEAHLVCQFCGYPLQNISEMGTDADGTLNPEYCKYCYDHGQFAYESQEELIDFFLKQFPNPEGLSAEERAEQYRQGLSSLRHWNTVQN